MAGITRDRGCLYYIPWIATSCVAFGAAALGVWVQYTKRCRSHTLNALNELNVGARHIDRFDDGLLATSITYLVLLAVIYLACFWRSFVEAAHDATGVTGGSSLAFLIVAYLLVTGWLLMVCWLVLLLIANCIWSGLLYVFKGAISQALLDIARWGQATWLPSQNLPCPGQCLDLTPFVFITSNFQDACICDPDMLTTSRKAFQRAYDDVPGVVVGSWVMLVAAICLLVNFACMYSHTRRERELLMRVNTKVYSTF